MYNYFLDQKLQKEKEEKKEMEKKSEEMKLKRKKKMDDLVSKYEERIKNFVFQMAQKPIVVKKKNKKLMSNREEYISENSNKILFNKGFVFTSYKTDKDRIKDYLTNRNSGKIYTHTESTKEQSTTNRYQFVQPSMRFKPRTDLERVLDILKERGNTQDEQNVILRQMRKMGLVSKNLPKKKSKKDIDTLTDDDENYGMSAIEKHKKYLHNKKGEERKQIFDQKRKFQHSTTPLKRVDNSGAKLLRSELYNKTHFKAMENLAIFKSSTMNHAIFKEFSDVDIQNQKKFLESKNNFYSTISSGFKTGSSFYPRIKERNNFLNREKGENDNFIKKKNSQSSVNLIGNKKLLRTLEISKDIASSNPLLYNINFNSGKSDKNEINATSEQMNNLKKIAFETYYPEEEEVNDIKELMKGDNYDEYKKEQTIIIDGEEFQRSDLEKIANKVLNKCNWKENKVKYNPRMGQGKLMFTNGMTISEFGMKYGVVP